MQVILIVTTLASVGCSKTPDSGTEAAAQAAQQTYFVRGILRKIDFAERAVTVEHEEIPGYMPAMTMPFDVRTMAEVEPLRSGDAIEFNLVVTDKTSWIEGVRKITPSEVNLPVATRSETASTSPKVARLKEGDRLPEFQLVDDQSRPVTRATLAGKPLVLTFIFTRCPLPNFCPLMSNHLGAIRRAVAQDVKLKDELRLLSISLDPEYDTPETLAKYAERFIADHDQWRFATGTAEQVKKLTEAFSIAVQREGGTINHGLATALVGPDGVIRKIWRGNGWQPEEIVEELRKL